MFLKKYICINFFLAIGITSSYGLNLKERKVIYAKYVLLNKFEGEWIDPYSMGIFDADLNFEELQDSYTLHNDYSIKEGKKEISESFSEHRILSERKLLDYLLNFFVSDRNTVFSMAGNLLTVAAFVTFIVSIFYFLSPKTFILFMLILSTLWHWMKLYQEKIAEKQNLNENLHHPNECHRGDLHWYEIIYLYFVSYMSPQTDCKEYYKAQLVDPFWEVSLPMAMMNAFTSTICEPLKVFATTLRFCFQVLFSGLTMLQLSIALFSIFIFLLMWFRYSFIFCWGAISLFQPKSSPDHTTSQSSSFWSLAIKSLKSLFFWKSALIRPSEVSVLQESKKVCFCRESRGDKINALGKPDEFRGADNVQSKGILQTASLHTKKKHTAMVSLKTVQFRKCHKKSLSC